MYVQDLMVLEDNANAIWNDLQKGAYVFVCGATAMGSDVHRTLTLIASRQGAHILLDNQQSVNPYSFMN